MDRDALLRQYGVAAGSVQFNTRGLSQEESLRSPEAGGNCANWVLGHMVAARCKLLGMLDIEPPIDPASLADYDRGTEELSDATKALPFKDLRAAYKQTQKLIAAAIQDGNAELFERPLAEPNATMGDTVATAVAFMAFHDAYHAGQLGLLRRVAGREGQIK